jgi:hypothetical protein
MVRSVHPHHNEEHMKRFSAVALICLLSSACYTARVATRGTPGQTFDHAGATLLWGLTTTETEALECERGLQSVETYFPWWGYLVSSITAGIVVPIRKQYTCLAPAPAPAVSVRP